MKNKKNVILVKGATEHNLKIEQLEIPKDKLVVFTGVSGSGKSSLAFDTLYAEGQRRYVESLSSYARQFLGQLEKPKFEKLSGLSPTIAIEQKAASANPRSTVGTITEVYDYMRVLWARVGAQHCHQCGNEVAALTAEQLVDEIVQLGQGVRAEILAPLVVSRKGTHQDVLERTQERGFVRVRINGKVYRFDEDIPALTKNKKHTIEVVVDRIEVGATEMIRLVDSVETALSESGGELVVAVPGKKELRFSAKHHCAECNIGFPPLSPQSFSFNSPMGACESCNGLGTRLEMDPTLVVPDENLSIYEGAIAPFAAQLQRFDGWNARIFEALEREMGVDLDVPWKALPKRVKDIVLYGTNKRVSVHWDRDKSSHRMSIRFEGVANTLLRRLQQTKSPQMREFYTQYMSSVPCSECNGTRLRPESLAVKVAGKSINELTSLSVEDACKWFGKARLAGARKVVAKEILKEIGDRLGFLVNVGLSYLTLDRLAPTLSGGEAQRIRLASQLGAELSGVMYVLDEPSIGLHSKDAAALLDALVGLRDLGNTVIVVEHDRDTIERADHIVDFGPGAGHSGGKVVCEGDLADIKRNKDSLTGAYLRGTMEVAPRKAPREAKGWLALTGASLNNLRNVNVEVPVGTLTVFSGVSGAGKSSLLSGTLLPALQKQLHGASVHVGPYKTLTGVEQFDKVIHIDQKPIGRTPRSNPVTYTKAFDEIRKIMALTKEAKARGYDAGRFSFNVKGGRCEACGGAGVVKVEMHFLADVYVTCEVCKGHRYNDATLQIRYRSRNIKEILDITVDEAQELFSNHRKLSRILQTLQDVGMGYVHLGQPATTLSGGEAQRIKLSRELAKRSTGRTLYVLDEPTTGLHFDDVRKLLIVLQRLVDEGNTVLVIEHNMDVIQSADWIIDLGPGGGDRGGRIVAAGSPADVARNHQSETGKCLEEMLASEQNSI
ncbi:MAG: excinuclease ABC subunit UvrA [Deltaproteobacteria bacterium]|nr:excinuclease ABC subunit UvrA [Deltaproteobacteria bacterium]MBN2673946.1 excinuclease ABC subunit UvrA [Deltaproteobacteria bacterium]